MQTLVNNRIKYDLIFPSSGIKMFCNKKEALFRLKYQNFIAKLKGHSELNNLKNWFVCNDINNIQSQLFIYFDFESLNLESEFIIELNEKYFSNFKKWYIKKTLITHFISRDFFVSPYPIGIDLSIYYKQGNEFNNEWDEYTRYDFIIKKNRDEIIFNKTSDNVLISKDLKTKFSFQGIDFNELKAIEPQSKFIKTVKYIDQIKESNEGLRVIANNYIKRKIKAFTTPYKLSYRDLYKDLKKFYSEYLLNLNTNIFRIQGGGFNYIPNTDLNSVYTNYNQMIFKNEMTDINAATGMRDYGPFKSSPIAKDVQFIFIYENSDDANKLNKYLKYGLKHFPGLQTYVNISPTLANFHLRYNNQSLKHEINRFLKEKLTNNVSKNANYFVILIGPFKKDNLECDFNETGYYYIKKELLKKGISSQFIYYKSLRSENFHFFLPNIAIAILAKLGGIPWKLKENNYKELIIGFNAAKEKKSGQYIGSAVFFDNQGYLKKVNSFESGNLEEIVNHLKEVIELFRQNNPSEELKRIIIHTFKPYGKKEERIESLLFSKLRLDIPIIYIEINDTKTTTEICFDEAYGYGIPISGTYVKTGMNEFLLFNNNRYKDKPERMVPEEWPIKLRIYSRASVKVDEKQLISQVYEFSRLYWKSLKQKSQPVTTIYSKLIAYYRLNFEESIPYNNITQETPWFL
ncbi:MAG: hypothetical protein M1475_02445 [Actinobacteria bacterium]|nr:hypothetical protein [Cyanobacteriota bacterium]MCL6087249.1 hypothetical protein [Actinomycetota bacterium]